MAIQYSVQVRESCSTCEGCGVIYNAFWEACLAELGNTASDSAIFEWFDNHDAFLNGELPFEEEPCPDCDGQGYTIGECPLEDAPAIKALADRFGELERRVTELEAAPTLPPWHKGGHGQLPDDAFDVDVIEESIAPLANGYEEDAPQIADANPF